MLGSTTAVPASPLHGTKTGQETPFYADALLLGVRLAAIEAVQEICKGGQALAWDGVS